MRDGGSHSILRSKSPIGHQAGKRRKTTINAGSTLYYDNADNADTWQQSHFNPVDISSESQQKGNFYESRGQKFYQGNIPDHIWELINNL